MTKQSIASVAFGILIAVLGFLSVPYFGAMYEYNMAHFPATTKILLEVMAAGSVATFILLLLDLANTRLNRKDTRSPLDRKSRIVHG